jgi:site-specific DNA-methyltransferase (adenine-specific)
MTTRLINGDCVLVQEQIPDNSIDLLLTDLPYNISEDGAKPEWIDPETGENKNTIHSQRFDENFESNWDTVSHEDFLKNLSDWSSMWFKKLRKGGTFAIFISDQYISYLWKIMEDQGFEPKRVFTWKKPAAVPFNRKVNPVSGCEYVLWGIRPGGDRTFNSDAVQGTMVERYSLADKVSSTLYRYVKDDVTGNLKQCFDRALKDALETQNNLKKTDNIVHCVVPNTITYSGGSTKNKIHPTEKPVEVLKYFIELCSKPEDMIFDPFAGSGSAGLACVETGRNCILIERDTKMFSKMSERFNNNNSLFE